MKLASAYPSASQIRLAVKKKRPKRWRVIMEKQGRNVTLSRKLAGQIHHFIIAIKLSRASFKAWRAIRDPWAAT